MIYVYKEYRVKTNNDTGAMATALNEIFIGL